MKYIDVIDSHTGGEPTRVVVTGAPPLPAGSLAEQRAYLRQHHDWLRRAVVHEPRGSDVLVGALLCEPADARSDYGVIFFNNIGYLGMCGHGTIGLMATLLHLDRVSPGHHLIETPVGVVETTLHDSGAVTVRNVASYRSRKRVAVEVDGHGVIHGDVAWGGNWFFLVDDHGQELTQVNVEPLTAFCKRIRKALNRAGVRGDDGSEIDHVELFGPSARADGKNFVLCPGGAYDRSPCGTGTSAKLACLAADGKLRPGEVWRQEGIVGSVFEGSFEAEGDRVYPSITGTAHITAESRLIVDERDPFSFGILGE
jgi:4-hydroxyproline epimerase